MANVYMVGCQLAFPRLKTNHLKIIAEDVEICLKKTLQVINLDIFLSAAKVTKYADILSMLKVFVTIDIINEGQILEEFSQHQLQEIDESFRFYVNRTVVKWRDHLMVNWIEIVPIPSSEFMTKIDLTLLSCVRSKSALRKSKIKQLAEDRYHEYKSSINMLTGESYETNPNYETYLGLNESRSPWYTFYALNWIAQLQLFHQYERSNVILVSGATGVGKSSQVPKLIQHANAMSSDSDIHQVKKIIKYLHSTSGTSNRKLTVFLSEPRIKPSVDTAKGLRSSMNFGVKDYSVIRLYTGGKEEVDEKWDISLSIFTDKKLYEKIKNDLQFDIQKGYVGDDLALSKNRYDVIVDESHEHNPNMDMIISFAKYGYQNKIGRWLVGETNNKLIIMTATMDDDKPKIKQYFDLKEVNLICNDMHIEDPQNTQRFDIMEYFDTKVYDTPKSLYEATYEKIIQITSKDLSEHGYDGGNILVFIPTTKEIDKMINKILNNNTTLLPLPLHSQNPEEFTNYIVRNKSLDLKLLDTMLRKKNVSYNYCQKLDARSIKWNIIVATNIAEASITINNLLVVIETGVENRVSYNLALSSNVTNLEKISDSSRIQRRGRVGRIQDGIVWYMYPLKHIRGSPIIPKITFSNPIEVFFDVMTNFDLTIPEIIHNSTNFFFIHPGHESIKQTIMIALKSGMLDPDFKLSTFYNSMNANKIQLTFENKKQIMSIQDNLLLLCGVKLNVIFEVASLITYLNDMKSKPKDILKLFKHSKSEFMALLQSNLLISPKAQYFEMEYRKYKNLTKDLSFTEKESVDSIYSRIIMCFRVAYPNKCYYYENNQLYNVMTKRRVFHEKHHKIKITSIGLLSKLEQIPSRFFSWSNKIYDKTLEFNLINIY